MPIVTGSAARCAASHRRCRRCTVRSMSWLSPATRACSSCKVVRNSPLSRTTFECAAPTPSSRDITFDKSFSRITSPHGTRTVLILLLVLDVLRWIVVLELLPPMAGTGKALNTPAPGILSATAAVATSSSRAVVSCIILANCADNRHKATAA